MRRTRTLLLSLTTVALLAVTACSPASDPDPDATNATDAPAPRWDADRLTPVAEPAWVVETTPIGESAAIIGDTVVAYVTEGGHPITLIGVDAETGERRWSWPSSVQDVYRTAYVRTIDDGKDGALLASTGTPAFDEPRGEWELPLALLEPATGAVVASLDDMWVQRFYDCGLTAGVCFWGYRNYDDESEHFALRSDGSVERIDSVIDGYAASAYLGSGIHLVRDAAGDDSVVFTEDGTAQWTIPAADLARNEMNLLDSVSGWTIVHNQDVLIYELTAITKEPTFRITASQVQVGAIDVATGEVLWTRDGAMRCWLGHHHDPVLCRGDLGYEVTAEQSGTEVFVSGDVAAMGVDIRTGEENWSRTITGLTGLKNGRQGGGYASFGAFWTLEAADGVQVLDTASNELHPVRGEAMIGCTKTVTVTAPQWSVPGEDPIDVETGVVFQGCTDRAASSDPAALSEAVVLHDHTSLWVPAGMPWPDETTERIRVVQLENALAGYRL